MNDQAVSFSVKDSGEVTEPNSQSAVDVTVTTPFEGYKLVNLHYSLTSNHDDSSHGITLTYDHDGYLMGLEGKLLKPTEENGQPTTVNLECYINDQIIVVDFETNSVKVMSEYYPNFTLKVTTPFKGFEEISLNNNFVEQTDQDKFVHQLTASVNKIQQFAVESEMNTEQLSDPTSSFKATFYVNVTIPFEGYEQTSFESVYYEIGNDLEVSLKFITPFEGYEELTLTQSYYLTSINDTSADNNSTDYNSNDYSSTDYSYSYNSADYNSNNYNNASDMGWRNPDAFSYNLAAAINNQKLAIEFLMNEMQQGVPNFLIKLTTPFEGYKEISLKTNLDPSSYFSYALEAALEDHKMAMEFETSEMQLPVPNFAFKVITPFEGFKEFSLKSNLDYTSGANTSDDSNSTDYNSTDYSTNDYDTSINNTSSDSNKDRFSYSLVARLNSQTLAIEINMIETQLAVPNLSINVTTPFEGYEAISLRSVYQLYTPSDFVETDENISVDQNDFTYILAAAIKDQKIVIELGVSDTQLDVPNFSVNVVTPFKGFEELGLKSYFVRNLEQDEYSSQKYRFSYKLDFTSPTNPANMTLLIQSDFPDYSLVVETPFDGFEKMCITLEHSLNIASLEFNVTSHDQQYHLSGRYGDELFYSFNGTLRTPFSVVDDLSWTTYAQLGEATETVIFTSLNWIDGSNITFRALLEELKFEADVATPFDLLRNAKFSTRFEIDFVSDNDVLSLITEAEYNNHTVRNILMH